MNLPSTFNFRCCGCGAAAIERVKPCDCATQVGARDRADGGREYTVFISKRAARRLELSDLIKKRLIGIPPDSQDLHLEDHDWFEIIAALEGDHGA